MKIMRGIFDYNFWLDLGDKTLYELFIDLGFVSDSNYKPLKKKQKYTNNGDFYNTSYSFLFFYKKWTLKRNVYLIYLDSLFMFTTSFKYLITNNFLYLNNRGFIRRSQTSNNFLYNTNNKVTHNNYIKFFNFGWASFFQAMKYWFLVVLFSGALVYYCLVVKVLPFNKVVFQWFMALMFFYWLISGFVFFIKKYQYRYFTSSIQRFWRRCFAIFWMLEAYLFMWFLYLTLNANQEPVFMYDNIQVYKTHLFSWKLFILKMLPLTLLIIFTYFLILSLKWNTFSKTNYLSALITAMLFYVMWGEFYQFFHIVSYYGNLTWVYDIEDHLWNLEAEFKRTRVSNHFVTICLIAKFWHLVFVFVFWMFFVIRGLEISRLRYPLLSANFQNFIIIYVMGWIYMFPWIKYIIKKFLEMPYFWFYINNRRLFVYMFFNDLKLFYYNIFNNLFEFFNFNNLFLFNNFSVYNFYYWHESSVSTGYTQYRKNFIRDIFIKNLMQY